MSLITKIKTVVESIGLPFLYDNGGGINQLLESVDFSEGQAAVFAFVLSQTNFVDGKESANIGLFFAKETEFAGDALENDEIQESCKELAFDFEQAILNGNMLTVGDVTLTRFYDEYDVNLTGVAYNATFTETTGLNVCFRKV